MKIDYTLLKHTALFAGISETEIESMLNCLSATTSKYKKEQIINRVGDTIFCVSIILSGKVHIIKEDFWGNRTILSEFGKGQLFGETYAILTSKPMEVSVLAAEDCEILFLNVKHLTTKCSSSCDFHSRLIQNLLAVTAQKNLLLTQKIDFMSQRSTREKLLSYLSSQSQKKNSSQFEIPFNRQELADYLCVDRSAMSNELCKLRDEGILKFEKNNFELISER